MANYQFPSVSSTDIRITQNSRPREREILRLAVSLAGQNAVRDAATARHEILNWVAKKAGAHLPPQAWDYEGFEYLSGGRNATAVRLVTNNADLWAIRSDDPDSTVPGRIWTTEVVVGVSQVNEVLLSLRLLASSPERHLDIEPAVPGLVLQVSSKCGLEYDGCELRTHPQIVASQNDAEDLLDLLLDPKRLRPVFVLTTSNSGEVVKPAIDAVALTRKTAGMATVVVVPAEFTWTLTDRLGRLLSVFNGGIRVYLPGFTEDADPFGGNQLFLADQMSTASGQAYAMATLKNIAASESLRRLRLGRDVLSFAAVRQESFDLAQSRLVNQSKKSSNLEAASLRETQLLTANAQIEALKDDLRRTQEDMDVYLEGEQAAVDRARAAETKLSKSELRIQQLLSQLQERGESPDEKIKLPESWAEFAEWCEDNLLARVELVPRARREVKNSLYEDVQCAARCLLWLANDYRNSRMMGGDGDLRKDLESGIRNDRCGNDSFSFTWRSQRHEVEWHIKNGGNTRAPESCLRIYYFWDPASLQVVIVSMPAHIKTGAS